MNRQLPGRTGSNNKNTELGALNEIIKKLQNLNTSTTGSSDASRAEQLVQTSVLNSMNGKLSTIASSVSRGNLARLKETANDLQEVYTYLDSADPENRRISTITYSSVLLTLTVTETFSYAGSAGDYYVISSTLS